MISSNRYLTPEVGGDSACYADPYNVEAFREAVTKCVED